MKTFTSLGGVEWKVELVLPGSSNIMVVFRHPDGRTSRKDRYNWYISTGPEARSVTSRLAPKDVMKHLDEETLVRLFRRSMPISRPHIEPNYAVGLGGGAAGNVAGVGAIAESEPGPE